MSGPVWQGVDTNNKYHIVPGRADTVAQVSGPCYPVDFAHKYSGETLEPSFTMQGEQKYPIMDTIHSHSFREIITSAAAMAGFSGKYAMMDLDKHEYLKK